MTFSDPPPPCKVKHSIKEHSVKEHSVKEYSVKEHSVKEHSIKGSSIIAFPFIRDLIKSLIRNLIRSLIRKPGSFPAVSQYSSFSTSTVIPGLSPGMILFTFGSYLYQS